MMKRRGYRRSGFTVGELLIVVVILGLISAVIGGFCWQYSINTWLDWAGKDTEISWIASAGIGFVPIVVSARMNSSRSKIDRR